MWIHLVSFFFNDTATTEIYTLSLHDALPICSVAAPGGRGDGQRTTPDRARPARRCAAPSGVAAPDPRSGRTPGRNQDRKSTRLNSSHANISYAVFCLKKKNK